MRKRQRQSERRRTALTMMGALVVGFLLIGAVLYSKWAPNRIGHVTGAGDAAKKAGCTGVRNDGSAGRTHVNDTVTYKADPPSSGRHNPNPLPEQPQFFDRATAQRVAHFDERAVHNLEHGFVVGWYDSELPAAEVAKLKTAAPENARFLAVPWTREAFLDDRHFVLTAWQRTQRCRTVSPEAISDFTTKYVNYKTAPEVNAGGGSPIPPASPSPSPSRRPSQQPSPSASR